MAFTSVNERSTSLVHEGWDHLRLERPLAAWASWQRALRVDPGSTAAAQALSALESAKDLPLAALTSYRFHTPRDQSRRTAWDQNMRGGNLEDLDAADEMFDRLTVLDPLDAAAWFNKALCLAWAGENLVSVACLERVVALEADSAFDDAVAAWTLAEILRQGGGAETLADDLRFACAIAWDPGDTPQLLQEFPEIRQLSIKHAPAAESLEGPELNVFEWLDRPIGHSDSTQSDASQMPIVLASVFIKGDSLRLSSPRSEYLSRIEELLFSRLEPEPKAIRREATPLTFSFLDADLWLFRIPSGVEESQREQLTREAIERYFENEWIHRKRKGLADRSPLQAAQAAQAGDSVARAKLTAVVRLREQLGKRASTRALYKGYPFDRLRRRLGLELVDGTAVDPRELACAAPAELDRLDLSVLDDLSLLDAAAAAAGLRDDARTARLAADLLSRRPAAAQSADWKPLVSALVRQAMSRDDPQSALSWIEEARPLADAATSTTFDIWRAEILARDGRPAPALEIYLDLIGENRADAAMALDAALTMIDNGHIDEAGQLLRPARELARRSGLSWIERRCTRLLGEFSPRTLEAD